MTDPNRQRQAAALQGALYTGMGVAPRKDVPTQLVEERFAYEPRDISAGENFFASLYNGSVVSFSKGVAQLAPILGQAVLNPKEGTKLDDFFDTWLNTTNQLFEGAKAQVSTVPSFFEDPSAKAMAQGLGQGLGFMLTLAVGGGMSGAATKLGQYAVGTGIGTTYMMPQLRQEAIDAGIDKVSASRFAAAAAPILALSEYIGFRGLGKIIDAPAVNALRREAVSKATKQFVAEGANRKAFYGAAQTMQDVMITGLKDKAKVAGVKAASGLLLEGAQEFGQSYIQEGVEQIYDSFFSKGVDAQFGANVLGKEQFIGALEEAMYGGIIGFLMGGGGGAIYNPATQESMYGYIESATDKKKALEKLKGDMDYLVKSKRMTPQEVEYGTKLLEDIVTFTEQDISPDITNKVARFQAFQMSDMKKELLSKVGGDESLTPDYIAEQVAILDRGMKEIANTNKPIEMKGIDIALSEIENEYKNPPVAETEAEVTDEEGGKKVDAEWEVGQQAPSETEAETPKTDIDGLLEGEQPEVGETREEKIISSPVFGGFSAKKIQSLIGKKLKEGDEVTTTYDAKKSGASYGEKSYTTFDVKDGKLVERGNQAFNPNLDKRSFGDLQVNTQPTTEIETEQTTTNEQDTTNQEEGATEAQTQAKQAEEELLVSLIDEIDMEVANLSKKRGEKAKKDLEKQLERKARAQKDLEDVRTELAGLRGERTDGVEVGVGEEVGTGEEGVTQEELEEIKSKTAEKARINPKNMRDMYRVNRELFGLNRVQALASSVAMDRMVGAMAKRAGVPKSEMYGKIQFKKGDKAPIGALKQESPIFKSTAKEGLSNIQQKLATPEQWVKMIIDKGGKGTSQELEWIGLADFLNDYVKENNVKSVPKEVVEQYINDNQIEIVEVSKGRATKSDKFDIKYNNGVFTVTRNGIEEKSFTEEFSANNYIANKQLEKEKKETKHSKYTLEGGENYREVLLTLPNNKKSDQKFYKKEHFDEGNILAHLRINERTLPNGERVMFIEEVQSDWAQEGKKKGFREDKSLVGIAPKLLEDNKDTNIKRWGWDAKGSPVIYFDADIKGDKYSVDYYERGVKKFKIFKTYEESVSFAENVDISDSNAVPQMPYKKTDQWVGMAMRRALKMAADEGFDRVAWVTGEQSADRYDLSKTIEGIERYKGENPNEITVNITPKDQGTIQLDVSQETGKVISSPRNYEFIGKDLSDIVGKELAEDLLSSTKQKDYGALDLKVGGEGMKAFYNSILPKVAKKEAQRFDKKAKVEVIDFGDNTRKVIVDVQKDGSIHLVNEGGGFIAEYGKNQFEEAYKEANRLNERIDNSQVAGKQLSISITPEIRMNLNSAVPLFQGEQGAMLAEDGRFIVYALTDPNVSTPLHELAHVFEHYLTEAERNSVLKWARATEWTTEVSEKFARGFEKYLAEGKAPTAAIQKIFDRFKEWLTDIYNGIVGSDIDIELNDTMRGIYNEMLGLETEPTPTEQVEELGQEVGQGVQETAEQAPQVRPQKQVKANQKIAAQEVAEARGEDVKDIEVLYSNQFRNLPVIDDTDTDAMLTYEAEGMPTGLEKKSVPMDMRGTVEGLTDKGYLYYDNNSFYLTPKGAEIVDAIDARLETRKRVKEGTDLFPDEANIEENKLTTAEAKSVADKIRGLKINTKGKAFDATLGLPVAIYNGAVELIATSVEGGMMLKNAIAKAMKYIDGQMGGKSWNKGLFAKDMNVRFAVTLPNGERAIVERDTSKKTAKVIDGWYLPIEQKVLNNKQDKMPANNWAGLLRSKEDEDLWTGVRQWLEEKGTESVSKKEIQDFINNNRIELVNVVKSDTANIEWKDDGYGILQSQNFGYEIRPEYGKYELYRGLGLVGVFDTINEAKAKAVEFENTEAMNKVGGVKFSQYVLEGEKENYKEVLVTLPVKKQKEYSNAQVLQAYQNFNPNATLDEALEVAKNRPKEIISELEKGYLQAKDTEIDNNFKSEHWDEPNIVVHLRMDTRTDADGKKVLFLNELQSDWGQKGKKEGFETPEKKAELKRLQDEASSAIQRFNEIEEELDRQYSEKKKEGESRADLRKRDSDFNKLAIEYAPAEQKMLDSRRAFDVFQVENRDKVIPAPFVTDTNSWVKLGLKVAMQEAVKQGVDRIAWSTGTQQFERWGSEEIHWEKVEPRSAKETARMEELGQKIVNYKDTPQEREEFSKLADKSKGGGWTLAINEQTDAQAFQGNEEALRSNKLEEIDISVGTKEELRGAIKRNLSRERNDAELDKLTDRIWNRMQNEDSGTSLPRKEGMEGFYGVPSENSLGIVGGVASKLFGQEVGTVNLGGATKEKIDYFNEKYGNDITRPITESYAKDNYTKEDFDWWMAHKQDAQVRLSNNIQHSIEVTPELKRQVEKGLPMFGNVDVKIGENTLGSAIAGANMLDQAFKAGVDLSQSVEDNIQEMEDKGIIKKDCK